MYISNSTNIGMATLLHNNKGCMKAHTNVNVNVNNVREMGVMPGSNIIVGNTISGTVTTTAVPVCNASSQHHQQVVNLVSSAGSGGVVSTAVGGSSAAAATTNNIILPASAQTVLITNNATGASSILTYQQYQQNLLHQQPHQRLLITPNLVSLPISNLVSTSGAGLAVITTSNSAQHNNIPITVTNSTTAITNHSNNNQNAFLVATSSSNVNNTSTINSFQQQFQQQIAASATHSGSTNIRSILPIQQQRQQQQQQQSQLSILAVAHNKSNNNSNNHRQNALVISRSNNNSIIGNNVKQRLPNAGILTKSMSNVQRSSIQQQSPIIVNNIALQQMVNSTTGQTQLVSVMKAVNTGTISPIVAMTGATFAAPPTATAVPSTSLTTTSAISEFQKQQRPRSAISSLSHIKQCASLPSAITPPRLALTPPLPLQVQSQPQQQHQQLPQQLIKVGLNGGQSTCVPNRKGKTINSVQQQQLTNRTLLGQTSLMNGHKVNAISSCKNVNALSFKITTTTTTSTSNNITNSNADMIATTMTTRTTAATLLTSPIMKSSTDSPILNNSDFSNNKCANTITTITTVSTTTIPTTTKTTITKTNRISTTTPAIATKTTPPPPPTTTTTTFNTKSNNNNSNNNCNKISEINISSSENSSTSNITNVNSSSSPISSISCYNSLEAPLDNAVNNNNNINSKSSSINVTEVQPNTTTTTIATTDAATDQEVEPEIDIVINNVVCSFSVRCHLNLREIALRGSNVEYRRENGMVTMKLRRPYTTASIWSSGRVTCTGATSEEQAKIAGRRYARCLQTLGFKVRFQNFRVVNVLGTCSMPWAIKIVNFSEKYKREASYEPELHPGVTYKLRVPKATLKIFSTGSITVTAASVLNVQAAIEHIYPLVYEFRKKRSPEEMEILRQKQQVAAGLLDITENDNDVGIINNANETNDANKGNRSSLFQLKRRNDECCKPIKKQCFNSVDRKHYFNNTTVNKAVAASNVGHVDTAVNDLDGVNNNVLLEDDPQSLIVDDELIAYDPSDLIEGPEEDVNE